MKKLFIIVLAYNGGKDLLSCLKSLKSALVPKGWQAHCLVVDNGSRNGSISLLKKQFSNLNIIENKKNLGFAGGNNIGIDFALNQGASAILLLNQDTRVNADFILPLLAQLYSGKKVAIAAPVICFRSQGNLVYDLGAISHPLLGLSVHKNCADIDVSLPLKRDFVSGCCLMIKAELFKKIGLMHEDYFLYYEDDDFCHHARKAGYGIYVVPASQIFHRQSTAAGFFSPLSAYYNSRNRLLFTLRNQPARLPLVLINSVSRCLYLLFKNHAVAQASARGIADFLCCKLGQSDRFRPMAVKTK